jgi:SAM-dependent methyltransferase
MKTAIKDTVCLHCYQTLQIRTDDFYCPLCSRKYPIIHGVPILLEKDNLIVQVPIDTKPVSYLRNQIRKLLQVRPDSQYSTATQANVKRIASQLSPQAVVLFVGGGISTYGHYMDELGLQIIENSINLEIMPGPVVDIVADGHKIPFPDNYFDAIICQAVLEHTQDSNRVVAEIYRVLKQDGIVYAEIPFLAPVHMDSDFRRFTRMGIKELFSAFCPIQVGVNGSIASSFVLISINFCATLLSFNTMPLYHIWRFIFGWLFSPIKYLDLIFCHYSTAPVSASSTYFLGTKKN